MHKRITLAALALTLLVAALLIAGEKPWLDFNNCDFCKPWTQNGLMNEMTHEQLNISNGVMTISTVPAARLADYRKTSAMMNEIGQRAAKGEKVNMCGSCEAMGAMMMKGAKFEEVPTKTGSVILLTSSDPAMVTELHDWAKKNLDEYAKMTMTTPKK
ncbi:MAG: hypothetical protein IT585_01910 [candidate division Zixibacteria bacterium]|nr:hypothetical protein [candidate division Zixibacteria bacterium]